MLKYLLLFMLLPVVIRAEVVDIVLETDRTSRAINEPAVVTLNFMVENQLDNYPQILDGDGFTARLLRPMQTHVQRTQITNGRRTEVRGYQISLQYEITFTRKGAVSIPGLSFSHEGKTYRSNGIRFTIRDEVEDQSIQVRFIQSKQRLYVGQEAQLTIRFQMLERSGARLSNSGVQRLLTDIQESLSENFSYNILLSGSLREESRILNGVRHRVVDIPFSVMPQKAGNFLFGPFTFSYVENESVGGGDPFFGGSFFSRTREVPRSLRTPAMRWEVLPLPPAPRNFSGAMNQVRLSATVSDTVLYLGDGVTLDIAARGMVSEGVLNRLSVPSVPNLDIFPPQDEYRMDTIPGGVRRSRRMSTLIVPREVGIFEIPSISINWFDTETGEYRVSSTPTFRIEVKPSPHSEVRTQRYLSQEQIEAFGDDIAHIRGRKGFLFSLYPHRQPLYLSLVISPWLIMLFLFILKLKQKLFPQGFNIIGSAKAIKRLGRDLSKIEKGRLKISPISPLLRYIDETFSISTSTLSRDEIVESLLKRGVSQESCSEFVELVGKEEIMRYAGSDSDTTELVSALYKLCKKLEREARK